MWREGEGGGGEAEHEKRRGRGGGGNQGKDLNFEIRVAILQGKSLSVCQLGLERQGTEAGLAAIAFHWQADKQGAAWRQEGHYQRLGQTEIRACPGRRTQTHSGNTGQCQKGLVFNAYV